MNNFYNHCIILHLTQLLINICIHFNRLGTYKFIPITLSNQFSDHKCPTQYKQINQMHKIFTTDYDLDVSYEMILLLYIA